MSKLINTLIISLMFYSCSSPKLVNKKDVLDDVQIQPLKALELATPYIEEHATVNWNESELKTYIVKKGNWYYIMRTNYPAKTINYYLKPAVMVSSKSGKIKFSTK